MKKRGLNHLSKKIILALLIAFFSNILDQAYHIAFNQSHQIWTFFTDYTTPIYVISKFLIVFIVSIAVLSAKLKSIWTKSLILGVAAAAIFGVLLSYLFPYAYTAWIHLFHTFAIFGGSLIAFWIQKKSKFLKE